MTFTDEQLGALADALDGDVVRQVQGFHYPPKFVIRDCMRKPGNQIVWEGSDTDREAFTEQCRIERMRVAVALALTMASYGVPQSLAAPSPSLQSDGA